MEIVLGIIGAGALAFGYWQVFFKPLPKRPEREPHVWSDEPMNDYQIFESPFDAVMKEDD